jgi:hypothetical protein
VFKPYHDEVILAHRPDFAGLTPTEQQAARRERFKLAVRYGDAVPAYAEKRAVYDAASKAKGIAAFALTVGDFLNAPAVDEIGLSGYTGKAGETIRIQASDDFEATGVAVGITDPSGAVLEQGPATRAGADAAWTYQTTVNLPVGQQVSIEVTAADRPGHKTTKTPVRGWLRVDGWELVDAAGDLFWVTRRFVSAHE